MQKYMLVTSETLGSGDDDLGRILMRSFLLNLSQGDMLPHSIGLMNSGVKLACEGSPVLEQMAALANRGVVISACGTCLDFYGLKDALLVGSPGTMPKTVADLMAAVDSVVIS